MCTNLKVYLHLLTTSSSKYDAQVLYRGPQKHVEVWIFVAVGGGGGGGTRSKKTGKGRWKRHSNEKDQAIPQFLVIEKVVKINH